VEGPGQAHQLNARLRALALGGLLLLTAVVSRSGAAETHAPQGFGATTPGGAGATAVRVTTLADSGKGSLREALRQGHRTIVFDVAGEIALTSHLYVGGPFVTIDGLSAPAPGITLRGHGLIIRGNRGAHDVVVRGLRVRDSAIDGIQVAYGAFNVLIDRVSVAGSADGNVDISESRDVTVAWSIIGDNKKSMLIKYRPARITHHHNALVGSLERNPQVRIDDAETAAVGDITADIRNNVVANWQTGYGTLVWHGPWANVVNNVYSSARHRSALEVKSARVFSAGNVFTGEFDVNRQGTEPAPFAAAPVDTQDACTAAKLVLAHAGVRPLDAVDQRLLGSIAMPPCPAPALVASPATLTLQGVEKSAKPLEQTIRISTEGPQAVAWTATVSTKDGGKWLTATPASGTTPGELAIEATLAGLAAGTYPATVTLAPPHATAPALSIPIELVVAPDSGGAGGGRSP
jgi:pectate lyase